MCNYGNSKKRSCLQRLFPKLANFEMLVIGYYPKVEQKCYFKWYIKSLSLLDV